LKVYSFPYEPFCPFTTKKNICKITTKYNLTVEITKLFYDYFGGDSGEGVGRFGKSEGLLITVRTQ
jgi:hypothetical protein